MKPGRIASTSLDCVQADSGTSEEPVAVAGGPNSFRHILVDVTGIRIERVLHRQAVFARHADCRLGSGITDSKCLRMPA